MITFSLEKLIRDKVFISMQNLGQKIVHRRLSDEEFLHELKRKLLEEANELNLADAKLADELADLLEVIEAIGKQAQLDFAQLRRIQKQRRDKRGGFEDRVYVEQVTVADDDPWAAYYGRDPERFPETTSKS